MTFQLFDTMSRALVTVTPLEDDHIRIYTCGPTVYARAHVGNFRTFVFEDILRRWLERRFSRVTHVMNLTDVDDKTIRNARAAGISLSEETAPHIAAFFEDLDILGIRRAHHYPRATEYIGEMVELVGRLERNGLAYQSNGNWYFRIAGFPQYGKLNHIDTEQLVSGASGRMDADEYGKDGVGDFALWKAVGADETGWDTKLGRGRPGWHIECSAMSMSLLGESFDIHCGGVDNSFPHHENEIAQSEGATGRQFVQIWCHSEWLRTGGEKMAKSLGNVNTIPELVAGGIAPATLRYLLAAGAHYRRPLSLTPDSLHMSTEAVERWGTFAQRVAELSDISRVSAEPMADTSMRKVDAICQEALARFEDSMDDDLNLAQGMGHVFSGVRELNRLLDEGTPDNQAVDSLSLLVEQVDDVLGVLPLLERQRPDAPLSEVEQGLLEERAAARAASQWGRSDELRDALSSLGIILEDTPFGQRWSRRRSS